MHLSVTTNNKEVKLTLTILCKVLTHLQLKSKLNIITCYSTNKMFENNMLV